MLDDVAEQGGIWSYWILNQTVATFFYGIMYCVTKLMCISLPCALGYQRS
jgi:hypothetical protein